MRQSIISIYFIFLVGPASAQVSQFGGPNRNQVYDETGLLESWTEEGPELIATISGIGVGYASPAINDRGIYVPGMIDSTGYIFHFDHAGKLVWKYAYGKEFMNKYLGSRGTPTVENDRLYYSGTFGDAFCLDALTGAVIWKKNLLKDYEGPLVRWGYTESPLIYKDLIILTPGGEGHNIMAFNKFTGGEVWTVDSKGTFNSYCSPVLIEHRGEKLILMNTSNYLLLLEPASGKIRYRADIYNDHDFNAVSPLYHDGYIFYSSGYGIGSKLYRINEEEGTLDSIYFNKDLDCKVSGLILYEGIVYGVSDRKKQWTGVDLMSGKTVYTSRDLKPGSFILADNKFLIYTDMGEVALARPGKTGFDIINRFHIPANPASLAFAIPVLYEGTLYLRYERNIWLYRVK